MDYSKIHGNYIDTLKERCGSITDQFSILIINFCLPKAQIEAVWLVDIHNFNFIYHLVSQYIMLILTISFIRILL